MYIRDVFSKEDPQSLFKCMQDNPLAMLVVNGDDYPHVFHLPLLLITEGEKVFLKGHIAKANPLNQFANKPILAVFNGVDSYISPTFYETKKQDPRVVPTWNYVTVQVKGTLVLQDDAQWKLDLLTQLTNTHERQFAAPWKITDAPMEYIEKMLKGIVGIELDIASMAGKWKVSQNQPAVNKTSVSEHLAATDSPSARQMSQLVSDPE